MIATWHNSCIILDFELLIAFIINSYEIADLGAASAAVPGQEAAIALNYGLPSDQLYEQIILCFQAQGNSAAIAIAAEFPSDVVALRPDGGFFVWCKLPQNISAKTLLNTCATHGVTFLPGTRCYANGQGDDAIRLAFSFQPNDKIVEGIATLGAVLRQWQR
ncbi:MAG: hypothetical protein RMX96_32560 [Nostoc sp. ChiSLP02]|nr:hypothetical protein [Nostoc sp. DedSLP05]MDZ8101626.1 hypothetical protein [Nostoc sp. DedSLP01]MDZ8189558.1 hypothetical protein [Nostoc sp. ChiSLP02]